MSNILISGDPLDPQGSDLIHQTTSLDVGKPVPEGWRVMTGNNLTSTITRTAYRDELDGYGEVESELLSDLLEVRHEITRINETAGMTIFNPTATSVLQGHIDKLQNGE